MLSMCANGQLWTDAKPGKPGNGQYDALVAGWDKWNAKHAHESNPTISESDYPRVPFFDTFIKPPGLRRVILSMLNPDPARRATVAQVAENRWMKYVECCQRDQYDEAENHIDASNITGCKLMKMVKHDHLPPPTHRGHKFVRMPGSTDM